uniref:Uncharacterized protein n=1 Tax=Timema monikensis TaxID=170555 RepID=A0A7R9EIT8_9NEOP|nr:unnamed protein product [Timema monikensis]
MCVVSKIPDDFTLCVVSKVLDEFILCRVSKVPDEFILCRVSKVPDEFILCRGPTIIEMETPGCTPIETDLNASTTQTEMEVTNVVHRLLGTDIFRLSVVLSGRARDGPNIVNDNNGS